MANRTINRIVHKRANELIADVVLEMKKSKEWFVEELISDVESHYFHQSKKLVAKYSRDQMISKIIEDWNGFVREPRIKAKLSEEYKTESMVVGCLMRELAEAKEALKNKNNG